MKKYTNNELIEKKDISSDYFKLENFYKYIFENYLLSKVNLQEYENKIKNNDLGIGKYTGNIINELSEYLNLSYIYLLNNFFIEKLDIEDIELLRKSIDNISNNLKELYEMVERTYKEVILNNYFKGRYVDDKYNICYGITIPSNFARNDSVVLKIYYSDHSNINDNTYIENMNKQKEFIKQLAEELKNEISSKLDINCDILIERK